MLPLLRSFEQEPASLDRKAIPLTPGKRSRDAHSGLERAFGRCEAKSLPIPRTLKTKDNPQARMFGDFEMCIYEGAVLRFQLK